jgi:hypothetical protein
MSAGAGSWGCTDPFFGFREERELRAGVLDEDAQHVFTNGHCHSFAEAVARLVGRTELLLALDRDEMGRAQGHVMARIDGRPLDARGWVEEGCEGPEAERALEARWEEVTAIGPEGWLIVSGGWFEPRVADALPFAEALMARLGIAIDARPGERRTGKEVRGCTGS